MKFKKNKKISGLSLLEALVSTAIVGIGFVAILQMTNYSIQSIYTSGERTKAGYLTNMIAEDTLGSLNIDAGASGNFSEYITENSIDTSFCQNPSNANNATNSGNVYDSGGTTDVTKKTAKWSALLNNKDYLNCKGQNEQRNFTVFKIASQWTVQPTDDDGNLLNSAWYVNTNEREINGVDVPYVLDEIMYIGRIQMNLNDGKKRKYLYFQTDYKLFK